LEISSEISARNICIKKGSGIKKLKTSRLAFAISASRLYILSISFNITHILK